MPHLIATMPYFDVGGLAKPIRLVKGSPNMFGMLSQPAQLHSGNLIEQVLDDILALDQIDTLQALICQMAVVAGLAKGYQQGWCS